MKRNPQQGSVLIGVLLALGFAGFAYVATSTSFFKTITQQKAKTELDVLSKSLTNAIFNYTTYAIKERWCMDDNWGRDQKCGASGSADMKGFVSHPRNLERFLWSKTTLNDMANRYEKTYGSAPTVALGLSKLEQNISINSLESLGESHPLNLVMNDNIKKCLSSVTVTIEKPMASYYKSQGDEVYLLISVKGNLSANPLNRCSLIKQTPVLKGMVIVYPKTLNQYALIKAEDFKISDYGSSNKGLDFYGPVYVQRHLILPSAGQHGVSFKDKVRIGEGILQVDGKAFTPDTPGGLDNQYLSQIPTMNGFLNGISLEAEVDQGLPRLFGGAYDYPTNVNMAMCKSRKDLKDNFSLTKNSRLFVKGSNGNYTFALSESNEFREYIRNGAGENDKYIYNTYLQAYTNAMASTKNQFAVEVKDEPVESKPIMEAYISVDGSEYAKVLLGRNSEAKITFGNKEFYQKQKELLDTTDTTYLDIDKVDLNGMRVDSSLRNAYSSFEDKCDDAKDDDVSIPECKKVKKHNKTETATDCSAINKNWEKEKCIDTIKELNQRKQNYLTKQHALITDLTNFISSTPAVVLKTSALLSNKEDVRVNWENRESFKYPFVSNIESIKFRFNVYDFAIEESINTTAGLRAGKNQRLPGPNEYGSNGENAINYEISRDNKGNVQKIETKRNDGTNLDSALSSNWGLLKSENKSYYNPEPPGNTPGGSNINYPVDGLSVADAKDLDKKCEIDTNALPPPSWDISFTEHTQFSWLYNVTNPGITIVDPAQVKPMPLYTFTSQDMDVGNYQGVPTRSIVKECVVPHDLDLVFGFYVCETLRVDSRTRPLNFVGTFIVKNLRIDASALGNGVNFYSLWSTGGIELLREKRHLRREKAKTEACTFTKPGWFSGLDEDTLADYQSCSPAKFLYQGANNFNWTTIDPEIGITDANTQVTTQSKVVNRYRRYGANVIWLRNGAE
jgi:hypothetical protein